MKRGRKYWKRSPKKAILSPTLATEKSTTVSSHRAHNLVDALFYHFKKWKPEVLQSGKLAPETEVSRG